MKKMIDQIRIVDRIEFTSRQMALISKINVSNGDNVFVSVVLSNNFCLQTIIIWNRKASKKLLLLP